MVGFEQNSLRTSTLTSVVDAPYSTWRAAKLSSRGCKARISCADLRMADELGEPLELCLFPFGQR